MNPRWKRRPPGSNWGDFGADDQLGRLNLITPEKVRQGVAEVKEGKTFCLSMPLDYPGGNVLNPRRHPPRHFATLRDGNGYFNFPMRNFTKGNHTDVVCDDAVLLTLQYSTQWDSFAHVGSEFDADSDGSNEIVYYNGYRADEHVLRGENAHAHESWERFEGSYAHALGIERMAEHGVQGRAVMINLHAHFARERRYVGYDDLMLVMQRDNVVIEPGDIACFYTGFDEAILEMGKQPDKHKLESQCAGLDGRDEKLLQWISDSGVAILVSDNYAVEQFPSRAPNDASQRHAFLPLHELCLFKLGIHLGELWYLSALAKYLRAAKRSRFLLTAPPLRLPGAVGSPATPIATV